MFNPREIKATAPAPKPHQTAPSAAPAGPEFGLVLEAKTPGKSQRFPVSGEDWTIDDWRDLWDGIEKVKARIVARHASPAPSAAPQIELEILAPCPFCGCEPRWSKGVNGRYVQCTGCFTRTPILGVPELRKLWNTRTRFPANEGWEVTTRGNIMQDTNPTAGSLFVRPLMRAKLEVREVVKHHDDKPPYAPGASEELEFAAVCGTAPFGKEGESEDNTYARFTPTATLKMVVTNPGLFDKVSKGQKFYVDFTEAT